MGSLQYRQQLAESLGLALQGSAAALHAPLIRASRTSDPKWCSDAIGEAASRALSIVLEPLEHPSIVCSRLAGEMELVVELAVMLTASGPMGQGSGLHERRRAAVDAVGLLEGNDTRGRSLQRRITAIIDMAAALPTRDAWIAPGIAAYAASLLCQLNYEPDTVHIALAAARSTAARED